MSKNKIEYLKTIELKVKDVAGEFTKTAIVTNITYNNQTNITTFIVNTISGFIAGDLAYIDDGINSKFITLLTVERVVENNNINLIMTTLGDYSNVNIGSAIKKSDAINYIDEAILIYAKYKPLINTYVINGNNSDIYDLPDNWCDGFSQILSIEFPLKSNNILEENNYELYLDTDNKYKIKFVFALNQNDKALLTYNTLYNFDNNNPPSCNVPVIDYYCVCNIASYLYLMALASSASHNVSSLINADRVDKENKIDALRKLAKEYLGQAASWLGVSLKELDGSEITPAPASSSQGVEYQDERVSIFGKNKNAIKIIY